MSRNRHDTADTPGQDSFLDILANITGILIILVMVMGVRAGRAPVDVGQIVSAEEEGELRRVLAAEASLRNEVLELAAEAARLEQAALAKGQQRHLLAAAKIEIEEELADRRARLDADRQAAFDLRRKLAEAEGNLAALERQRAAAETARPETVVIESYPTPISRTVHGEEEHFQLRDGTVMRVPMNQLVEQLEREVRRKRNELLERTDYTGIVGPIDGFRMRYTLRRRDIGHETDFGVAHVGTVVQLQLAEFLPVAGYPGEPVEAALRPASDFRKTLGKLRPGWTTVTLWTYPGEFDAFRRLRQELYHLGFAVAARPLPEGTPISGSPGGTRSAAQ